VNWNQYALISFLLGVGMAIWMLVPAIKCAASEMAAAQIQGVDDASTSVEDATSQRVVQANSFFGRFFGQWGECYTQNRLSLAEPWKQWALIIFGAAFLAFLLIGRLSRPLHAP